MGHLFEIFYYVYCHFFKKSAGKSLLSWHALFFSAIEAAANTALHLAVILNLAWSIRPASRNVFPKFFTISTSSCPFT